MSKRKRTTQKKKGYYKVYRTTTKELEEGLLYQAFHHPDFVFVYLRTLRLVDLVQTRLVNRVWNKVSTKVYYNIPLKKIWWELMMRLYPHPSPGINMFKFNDLVREADFFYLALEKYKQTAWIDEPDDKSELTQKEKDKVIGEKRALSGILVLFDSFENVITECIRASETLYRSAVVYDDSQIKLTDCCLNRMTFIEHGTAEWKNFYGVQKIWFAENKCFKCIGVHIPNKGPFNFQMKFCVCDRFEESQFLALVQYLKDIKLFSPVYPLPLKEWTINCCPRRGIEFSYYSSRAECDIYCLVEFNFDIFKDAAIPIFDLVSEDEEV